MHERTLAGIFRTFLRFGFQAWGGPVAQIAMFRHALVERERWVEPARFNRALAVYQVLPGPEATEMACWLGMVARGRLGAIAAGLGFVLPGFVLMLALSWAYVEFDITTRPGFVAILAGLQAGVIALMIRAAHRLAGHVWHGSWLTFTGLAVGVGSLAGVHFAPLLIAAGAAHAGFRRAPLAGWLVAIVGAGACVALRFVGESGAPIASASAGVAPESWALALSGLKAGLLTFGGAYTVIPFLESDAVASHGWLTHAQFLDGIGLSGILPAPLIIFATFIGFVAGGWAGSIVMTVAIFLPAFGFTLIGHEIFERVIDHKPTHAFLDGVAAGVIGLIGATICGLIPGAIDTPWSAGIATGAIIALYKSKARWAIPAVVAGCAAAGWMTGA